jgi:protein gp37
MTSSPTTHNVSISSSASASTRIGDKVEEKTISSTSDERVVNNVMRHEYRVLTDTEKDQMRRVKDAGLEFHQLVAGIGTSRELSLALTRIEEAVMWAVKHITK